MALEILVSTGSGNCFHCNVTLNSIYRSPSCVWNEQIWHHSHIPRGQCDKDGYDLEYFSSVHQTKHIYDPWFSWRILDIPWSMFCQKQNPFSYIVTLVWSVITIHPVTRVLTSTERPGEALIPNKRAMGSHSRDFIAPIQTISVCIVELVLLLSSSWRQYCHCLYLCYCHYHYHSCFIITISALYSFLILIVNVIIMNSIIIVSIIIVNTVVIVYSDIKATAAIWLEVKCSRSCTRWYSGNSFLCGDEDNFDKFTTASLIF